MDQWQSYPDSAGSSRRHNGNNSSTQSQMPRDYNGNGQSQPPAGFTYEQYQNAMAGNSQAAGAAASSAPQVRDGNGDVAMQDAGDPYSGMKYPMRPHHQQHLSGSRTVPHYSNQEPSSAAQRYSPMDTLSPSSPYVSSPPQSQYGQVTNHRQSPTRPGNYSSPNSYYNSRQAQQQLPPITPYSSNNDGYPSSAVSQLNAVFGNDPKSPSRRPAMQSSQGPPGNGPVPEFTKVRSMSDLKPRLNSQPPFRRANPEGGFLSVS